MESKETITERDEIDFADLIRNIWSKRWSLIKITLCAIIVGGMVAFFSPVEYEASCKLLPEMQNNSGSNLGKIGGLAELSGINLGQMSSQGGAMSPRIYPIIGESLPLILTLINDTIYFENLNLEMTPLTYFKEHRKPTVVSRVFKYTVGLPGLIIGFFSSKDETPIAHTTEQGGYLRYTRQDWQLIEHFKDRISVEFNDAGIIRISSKMPDPFAAAELSKNVEEMLTTAIVRYHTDKALNNLRYIEKSYEDAKTKFENIQLKLASERDKNRNISSSTARIELKKVENEYNVVFNVYKNLALKLEQAKIKLKEDTPIFSILEPVRVPEKKSEPKSLKIIVIFTFLSLGFGLGYFFLQYIWLRHWKELMIE